MSVKSYNSTLQYEVSSYQPFGVNSALLFTGILQFHSIVGATIV